MFEIAKQITITRRKNEEYHEATWDTRDITSKEYIIRKALNYSLPTEMNEEVK